MSEAGAEAAAARPKRARAWYIVGVPVVAIIFLSLVACSDEGSDNGKETAPSGGSEASQATATRTPTRAAEPEATPTALIGQPLRLQRDGWIITITGANIAFTVKGLTENKQPAGVYLILNLKMENISTQPQALAGDRFKIIDEAGRQYGYFPEGTTGNGQQGLGARIGPGQSTPATIVFDVPGRFGSLWLETLDKGRIGINANFR